MTQIHLQNLLHDPGWNFGVKAFDDYVKKVKKAGRTIKGIASVVMETTDVKKYSRINSQLIPQLKKEHHLTEIVEAAVMLNADGGSQTVTEIMENLIPFNLSRYLVENTLRGLSGTRKNIHVELNADLENIYTDV
ncbi:MAG: hypothetical protein GY797_37875 [Deltaproteobacteria bacterium]|nr:hypothetical protein [Deltaproteobacteria bacterium]